MITIQLPEPRPLEQLSRVNKPILREPRPERPRKRKKKRARRQRHELSTFEQTPVGYLIKHECPIEWQFITDLRQIRGLTVTADFLESIAYMSDNPVFRSERFRRALLDFREYGYATPNKRRFDLDDELRRIKDRLCNKKRMER